MLKYFLINLNGGDRMKEYEVNSNTLALISVNNKTKVYENDRVFIVDKNANEIIEDSCSFFGSSLSGRQKGTASLIGVTYKCPIIIEESKNIIFFPTCSPRINSCSWIGLKNIENYYSTNTGKVIIKFKNGQKLHITSTYGIIENQILRSTRLESVLRGRINQKSFN